MAVNFVKRNKFTRKKSKGMDCDHGSVVIIKTIRVTADHLRTILDDFEDKKTFKIIHLLRQEMSSSFICFHLKESFYRDPRAILASLYRAPKNWKAYMREANGTVVCRNMQENKEALEKMRKENLIHDKNFLEVDYDKWVGGDDIMETTKNILSFLSVNVSKHMERSIFEHFNTSKVNFLICSFQ